MIDSLLRAFGLRIGRFTSPHLHVDHRADRTRGTPDRRSSASWRRTTTSRPTSTSSTPGTSTPLSFFEVLMAMAFAAFADAPVDVAVVEVGLGGTWDCHQRRRRPVAVVTPIGARPPGTSAHTIEEIAGEKAGIIKPGAYGGPRAAARSRPPRSCCAAAVEVDAIVAREGLEFGVLSRDIAVGGQQLTLRGLAGTYGDVFLPLLRRAPGAQRGRARWPRSRRSSAAAQAELDDGRRASRVRRRDPRPGASRWSDAHPTVLSTPRTTRPAPRRLRGRRRGVLRVRPARRCRRSDGRQGRAGDPRGVRAGPRRGRHHAARRRRAPWTADELGAVAVDVFGIDRVEVVPLLDDAIERRSTLAEEAGDHLGGCRRAGHRVDRDRRRGPCPAAGLRSRGLTADC